jgi:hypothetical protein
VSILFILLLGSSRNCRCGQPGRADVAFDRVRTDVDMAVSPASEQHDAGAIVAHTGMYVVSVGLQFPAPVGARRATCRLISCSGALACTDSYQLTGRRESCAGTMRGFHFHHPLSAIFYADHSPFSSWKTAATFLLTLTARLLPPAPSLCTQIPLQLLELALIPGRSLFVDSEHQIPATAVFCSPSCSTVCR